MEIKKNWVSEAKINKSEYDSIYKKSILDNDGFWSEQAERIHWNKKFTKTKNFTYSKNKVDIKWFEDGQLNVSYNCVDRYAEKYPDRVAIIWEGDDPTEHIKITYKELLEQVCQTANSLKKIGIKKGDRVTIYLTMIPELAYVMLACARIGAIHSIIFGGFSSESISGRIQDCKSKYIVTADEGIRGGKIIPLKKTVDKALESCPDVSKCIVVKRTGNEVNMLKDRDFYLDELTSNVEKY